MKDKTRFRIRIMCGAGLLCVAGIVVAGAFTQGRREAVNYWPMTKGNEWAYITKNPGGTSTDLITVRGVVEDAQGKTATLNFEDVKMVIEQGKLVQKKTFVRNETYRFNSGGLSRLSDSWGTYNPPLPLVPPLMTDGKKWTWSGTIIEGGRSARSASAEFAVSGPFDIEVPASNGVKLKAMKVSMSMKLDNKGYPVNVLNEYWFARGYGPIRIRWEAMSTGSLKSFTLK